MNVCQLLSERAKMSASSTALVEHRGRFSYQELDAASARVAGTLLRQGVRPGDAALILVPLSRMLYLSIIASLRIGAIPVLIDPGQGRAHLERCCELIKPRVFIGSPLAHLMLLSAPGLRRIPLRFSTSGTLPGSCALFSRARETAGIVLVGSDGPALITFTSGSTGMPKVITRSHGFLLAQHRVLEQALAHATNDVVFSALPVFILSHLAAGLTCVIPDCDLRRPGNIAADRVITQLALSAVTSVEAPPSLLEQIVGRCLEKKIRLGVRRFLVGGGPVFPRLIGQLEAISPGCEVINIYGSSEAEPIAQMRSSAISAADICAMKGGQGLLVGTPIPSIKLRVLSETWATHSISALEKASLPSGQIGEIVVSGDHVHSGCSYPEDVSTTIRENGLVWHRTGDVGYMDPTGRLWLLGRVGTFEDGRGKLYPLSMEIAMSFCPTVQRCAFFIRNGERILALQTRSQSAPDLTVFAELLEKFSVDKIWEVAVIPTDKRHNSKIDYTSLLRSRPRREYKIQRDGQRCN